MGCNQATLHSDYDDDDDAPLNEEKTEYDKLPSVTMILGERIDKYFSIEKILGITDTHYICHNK